MKFKSPEDIEAWLSGDRANITTTFAARSALRVLPFISGVNTPNGFKPAHYLKTFHEITYLAIYGTWPSTFPDVVLTDFEAEEFQRSGRDAAECAMLSTFFGIGTVLVEESRAIPRFSKSVRYAAKAMEFAGAAPIGRQATNPIYSACFDDALFLETFTASSHDERMKELMVLPLWQTEIPEAVNDAWGKLKDDLSNHDNGQVWIDWYEDRLSGFADPDRPLIYELERARFEIRIKEWEHPNSPAHVNGIIAELETQYRMSSEPLKPQTDNLEESEKPKLQRDFFISYSKADEAIARRIYGVLADAGFSAYVQFNDFPNGSNFIYEMNHGIANSDRFIALYSEAYWSSEMCQSEWSSAFRSDPTGAERRLIGFLLEPCKLKPLAQSIVYTSLIGLTGQAEREAILNAVRFDEAVVGKLTFEKISEKISSPRVRLTNDQIDLGPNLSVDRSSGSPTLNHQIDNMIFVCGGLIVGAPGNASGAILHTLESYKRHLEVRRPDLETGLLEDRADIIFSEFNGDAGFMWLNDGALESLVNRFKTGHAALLTCFPESGERERIMAQVNVDVQNVDNDEVVDSIKEVAEVVVDLSAKSLATERFKDFAEEVRQEIYDIKDGGLSDESGRASNKRAGRRKRFILQTLAVFGSALSVASSSITIMSTSQGQSLLKALRRAIEALLRLVG